MQSSASGVQSQRTFQQQPTAVPSERAEFIPSEPPSYDESQAMNRATSGSTNNALEPSRDIRKEPKSKPSLDRKNTPV